MEALYAQGRITNKHGEVAQQVEQRKKWSLVGDSYSNDFKLGKPFVVGSNPTERDFFFVDQIRLKWIQSLAQQLEFDLLWIKEKRRPIKKRNVN